MEFDLGPWHSVVYIIGEATVIFILAALLISFVLVVISLYSIKKGRLYFPRLIKAGIVFFEGFMKGSSGSWASKTRKCSRFLSRSTTR